MGTISDKLMRIINTKEDIRQALISKGYDVPTSIPFKEYAKMILDLPCNADSFPDIEGIVARYSASGITNEQMAANPVWVDKTGNGRDLQLKNFSWKGMSGVGGYVGDFSKWVNNRDTTEIGITKSNSKVIIDVKVSQGSGKNIVFISKSNLGISNNATIKITSTYPEGVMKFSNSASNKYLKLPSNGIITLQDNPEYTSNEMHLHLASADLGQITIEQLPLYPGALVFDGVDDYGTCDNFPILTKEKGYTVVALRQYITRNEGPLGLVSNIENWFKDGAFLLEFREIAVSQFNRPISFGAVGKERDLPCVLTYQTSKSYNGVSIEAGNFTGTDVLHVGKLSPKLARYCNAAIWELVFLDHDATEEELTKIKDYFVKTYPWLFPDQAWTVTGKTNEDEDRATIANITGNGNDLVLSNFAFSGNSGYGEYAYNFNDTSWISIPDYGVISDKTSKSFNIKSFVLADYPVLYTAVNKDSSIKKVKIKVTNSIPGFYFGNKPANQIIDLSTDGIYEIPSYNSPNDVTQYGFRCSNVNDSCNITIEQIPEYEGYLVTDGVDDKAVSKQFKFGENFTVILDFKFPVKKISYCGFDLSSKVRIQNLQGSGVYVVLKGNRTLIPSNVVRAVTSEGKVYDENWNEYNIVPGNISSNYTMVNLGFDGSNQFAESATKLAGIYSSALSKDDCIKAYNYLQTLKSK